MPVHAAVKGQESLVSVTNTRRETSLDEGDPAVSWIQLRGPLPLLIPMPPGDERPGRPVNPDPA